MALIFWPFRRYIKFWCLSFALWCYKDIPLWYPYLMKIDMGLTIYMGYIFYEYLIYMKPKNTHCLRFAWYFSQATMYQKSEWYFFEQGLIDGKSEVKVERCHIVVELKLKMLNMQKVTFSILTPPPGGIFELLLHFSYPWNIAQKSIIQISDMLSINKFHWNFAPCMSGILKFKVTFYTWKLEKASKRLNTFVLDWTII